MTTLPHDKATHARLAGALAGEPHARRSSARGGRQPAGALSRREALAAGAASMAWLLTLGHGGTAIAAELSRLAQEGPMTGARLAGLLRAERARWSALLETVGVARIELPGVEGEWSVKQIVAHLTWYEAGVVEGARQVVSSGRFTRGRAGMADLGRDERNSRIAAESQARPVGDVLAEADRVWAQLLAVVAACPDELLNDPSRLGLPNDALPWMLVANNTYGHYRQHAAAVRAWLERRQAMGQGSGQRA